MIIILPLRLLRKDVRRVSAPPPTLLIVAYSGAVAGERDERCAGAVVSDRLQPTDAPIHSGRIGLILTRALCAQRVHSRSNTPAPLPPRFVSGTLRRVPFVSYCTHRALCSLKKKRLTLRLCSRQREKQRWFLKGEKRLHITFRDKDRQQNVNYTVRNRRVAKDILP